MVAVVAKIGIYGIRIVYTIEFSLGVIEDDLRKASGPGSHFQHGFAGKVFAVPIRFREKPALTHIELTGFIHLRFRKLIPLKAEVLGVVIIAGNSKHPVCFGVHAGSRWVVQTILPGNQVVLCRGI